MNIYGGLSLGVASPVSKVSAEPASPSGMSGVAYSSGSTTGKAQASDDKQPTTVSVEPGSYSTEGYTQPKKEQDTAPQKEEDNGFYIPTFDDNGTPHWTEPDPPQSQGHLDVGKLLEGQTEGYRLYSDGEGGFTQDPNSKGGIYYGPGSIQSTAPRTKKQTATAALPEVSQIYTMNGDDYSIDSTAFANAQRGTGEDQVAASIAGGSGGGSKRNSNVNDAIFGGESNKATPGYSLW